MKPKNSKILPNTTERRIKHWMELYWVHHNFEVFENHCKLDYEVYNRVKDKNGLAYSIQSKISILEWCKKEGMTLKEIHSKWLHYYTHRQIIGDLYDRKPQPEGRDNKGVYVGSGNSGYNQRTVRYPSKKRSKRTWKIFYKMFPYYAELDGWSGTHSTKVDFRK